VAADLNETAIAELEAHAAWTKVRKQAGVKGRWHDNRRTLVTELAESGAGGEVINDAPRGGQQRAGGKMNGGENL